MRGTRRGQGIAVAAILTFSMIAAQAIAAPGPQAKKKPGGGGGGSPSFYSASLMFWDGGPDLVGSDGGGLYTDGVDRVSAAMGTKRGGFRLDTSRSSRGVFVAGYEVVDDVDLRIGNPEFGDDLNLLTDLPNNGDEGHGTLSIVLSISRRNHVYLHYGPHYRAACPDGGSGDRATVTRETPTTWTVTATRASVMEVVRNNWNDVICVGFLDLPVTFTITAPATP